MRAPPPPSLPIAAQYVVTFLKPEMLHIYRQIQALRAFRPVVFCQKRENPEQFPFHDVTVVPKPPTHQLRRFWQKTILGRPITIYRSEARRLAELLRGAEARLLHIYFGHIGVHLLPLIEIAPIPVVVSFHGADAQVDLEKPAHAVPTRRLLQKARFVLVRSESIAARLESLGCDPGKIRIHGTGVPLDEIGFEQRSPPHGGAWRCVQACRLIPKKGLATTLRAFAAFAKEFPRAQLTIAGEGPLLEELRAQANALGIAHRVFFSGFLPQQTLRALIRESHLFLHPSEMGADGDQEGVPNSMLEAMASGLPVVATWHGGIPEAVVNGESGLLVPERDDQAMTVAMLGLARDPAAYARMSAAAAQRVMAQFDLQKQARVLEAIYTESLGG